jgi:predicted component of type VI protein secretion system
MGLVPRDRQAEALLLPDDAPRVRITAGAGTASQKSWYLRRPVTLIGSRRGAYIVLHGEGIAPTHCAIVNTGWAVLLKDLHTSSGTTVNGKQVDLVVLRDGDLIRVGNTLIQVAIHTFRKTTESPAASAADPLRLPEPIFLKSPGASRAWQLEDTCAVIGRGEGVAVRLADESVSPVHTLVFAADGKPAICALSWETATLVNGYAVSLALISPDDRLHLGGIELACVRSGDEPVEASPAEMAADAPGGQGESATPPAGPQPPGPEASLNELEGKLAVLHEDITVSWQKLNDWQTKIHEGDDELGHRQRLLAQREAEFDRQDAALRGRLHDLTCYQEELAAREAELRAQRESLEADRAALDQRLRELERRQRTLDLRERLKETVPL